ncbi:MAG: hypothetical protein B7X04_00370 [Parcubacteria group bacterium 21-54-25]|nr:MAG: hypothetical protein B7X04_00370 [Parcubacteria group bacterium 21-54-25]HQU07488.1 hypothetical protein [Candidatus Paceibacterota bacterium]
MRTRTAILVITFFAIIGAVFVEVTITRTSAISPTPSLLTATSTATLSTPQITFPFPTNYGLATTQEQILAKAYIPPCNEPFNYCLYYNGSAYKGTNFESAGLRIERRSDLTTSESCLTTPPANRSRLSATTTPHTGYATSVFSPLGDAAAGHYANGALYRLFFNGTCYEFETRVGETQFANYPPGAIQKFTDANRQAVFAGLQSILDRVTITSTGARVQFPAS